MKRLLYALLITGLALAALLTVMLPAYVVSREMGHDPSDTGPGGCSILRAGLTRGNAGATIVSDLLVLDDVDDPSNTVLVLVGGGKVPTRWEADAFHTFIDRGGKAIIFGEGKGLNVLSQHYGVSFFDQRLLDDNFIQAGPMNSSVFDVDMQTASGLMPMRLNAPTALELAADRSDLIPLAVSSHNSSLDLDGDGLRSIGDRNGPLTLAVAYDPGWDGRPATITSNRDITHSLFDRTHTTGRIVFIADCGGATNQMCQGTENVNVTRALALGLMLPLRFNGTYDDVDAISGRFDVRPMLLFDSSRTVRAGPSTLMSNMLSTAVLTGNLPQIWGVLALNLAGLTILWIALTRHPASLDHTDRLDDTITYRELVDYDAAVKDTERLRWLMARKLAGAFDPSMMPGDIVNELAGMERKRLMKLVKDRALVKLLGEPESTGMPATLARKVVEFKMENKGME